MAGRYEGKPLLRLVELYILWAIGELPEIDEMRLREMTPKLQALYGVGGTWQEVIASVLHFPPDAASAVRAMWLESSRDVELGSGAPTPQQFAEFVADESFGSPRP